MKNKFLIFIIFFVFILAYDNVFASSVSNYDTNYNMTINELDILDNSYNDEYTYSELLDNFSNLRSDYYNILITISFKSDFSNVETISFNLFPKSLESIDISFFGFNSNNSYLFYSYFPYSSGYIKYSFNLDYLDNILENSTYNLMLDCLNNNNSCSSPDYYNLESRYHYFSSSISNDLSYDFNFDTYNSNLFYSSTIPIILTNNFEFRGSVNQWYKNLIINDTIYNIGDSIPTYKDLFSPESNIDLNKELDNYNVLGNFYFRINKSDISNFNFEYKFNPLYSLTLNISNPNYFNNFYNDLSTNYLFYGRKYNSTLNYYTYDEIQCSISHNFTTNNNIITSSGNNLICTSDLTDYDYIFLYFHYFLKTNENINQTVKFIDINVNNALYHYGSQFNGYIYDIFPNVSKDFKMSFSSNYIDSALVLSNVKEGAFSEAISTSDNDSYVPLAQTNFPFRLAYGYSNSRYYVIYGDSSIYNGTRNIEVFIGNSTIISFNNSSSTDFYIYDKDKNITNVNANVQFNLNINSGEYDLTYYFVQVNSYINGLSSQVNNFGNLTQNMYDNLPGFLQMFLFVSFILFCTYFTYRLIKK